MRRLGARLRWVTGDSLEFDRNVLDEEMEYERERRALVRVEGGEDGEHSRR